MKPPAPLTAKGPGPAIRVRGLVNKFGRSVIHDGLDLEVKRGEVIAVHCRAGLGRTGTTLGGLA